MGCKAWREEWVAQLYGEVTPEERERIEAHLGGCSDCRETMRQLDATRSALAESAPAVASAPPVVLLRPRRAWGAAWGFAAGLAAAALLFFFGSAVASRQESDLEDRLAKLEQVSATRVAERPQADGEWLTRTQFQEEMERIARRHRREREEDLDYLMRWFAASEQRTGKFMNRTQQALTYLALRDDPQLSER
jgi:hypothetical protein